MIYEIESNQLCFVVYLWILYVTRFMLYTPMGDVKTMIYELSYMYIVIKDHYMWSFVLNVFPLSYKLIMGVSSL